MSSRANVAILLAGLAAIAFVTGFMVGGSATPVAKVAIPIVFGLAVSAVAALQTSFVSKSHLEAFKHDLGKLENLLLRERAALPRQIGACLLAVAIGYGAGVGVGMLTRIREWIPPRDLPDPVLWGPQTVAPPNPAAGLNWILLERVMRERRFPPETIQLLFDVQQAEWRATPTPTPVPTPTPAQDQVTSGTTKPNGQLNPVTAQQDFKFYFEQIPESPLPPVAGMLPPNNGVLPPGYLGLPERVERLFRDPLTGFDGGDTPA